MNSRLTPEPLLFIDLETTGANFATDRIIEIGFVRVDHDGVHEWSSLVDPGRAVSAFITGLTGISTAMVSSAPRFEELAPVLLEELRGRLLVAHNARFDYSFLRSEFKRIGIEFRAMNLCTVKLSRALFPHCHRHNLDTLVERFGMATDARHRALGDARVLWQLWQCWHELFPGSHIQTAVDAIIGRPQLPPKIDPALADDLPECPGAYALYDKDGGVIQVKRCANLRRQIFRVFSTADHQSALWQDTYRIDWREATGELGARLGELKLNAPARGKATELCSWQLKRFDVDDYRPELVFACDIDFGLASDLFGLYSSRREAVHALRQIAEAHGLCHDRIGLSTAVAGKGCAGYKRGICRGACLGKERPSVHSARTMAALAKLKLARWPYEGPVALIERDEFGTREDYHLIDSWCYLGTVNDEAALHQLAENRGESHFEPVTYRIVSKFLKAGKVRVLPLF